MKFFSLLPTLAISLLFLLPLQSAEAHRSITGDGINVPPPRWEKLGQRRVNFRLDRDEIIVTAREGTFTSLRLKAELAPINLHRIVIHYGNGQTETVQVNRTLRVGAVTPNFDLPGNRRVIQKVVFIYDTRNRAARQGRLELWGRRG
ncbi:MAG: hypothetical protein AAGJ82_02275 [Bacteroidota bacterium]